MSELSSLLRHAIEVGGVMKSGTKGLNVAVAKIVAKNNDEIGWTLRLSSRRRNRDEARNRYEKEMENSSEHESAVFE